MMRIVYIANARIPTPRAYGLQIMKTCEAFAAAGNSVELVVPVRRFTTDADPFEYYGIKTRFAFTPVVVSDLLHFGAAGFLLSAVLLSEKVRWMRSFLQAEVVYSRDPLILFQYLLLGRPLYFEAHAKPTFVSRIVARHAKRLIVISNGLKDAYIKAGVPAQKIIVAPDAVDEHLFDGVPERGAAREVMRIPAEEKLVLYAGHLYPRKGAALLAQAAEQVPEATFAFLGGAPDDIEAFRLRWGSGKNIRIIGHVPHARVPLALRAADLLVLPNSGKDEDAAKFTSPMKLFEYMASGTPILASDVPSIREVLTDESAAFFTPDDPDALAHAIKKLLSDVSVTEKGKEAKRLVSRHTWGGRARAILR
jgi:glycosyltransferase involved in cell wall biosynthesis